MKKQLLIFSTLAVAVSSIIVTSCKSKKTVSQVTGAKEIVLPFQGDKYSSDKNLFRAKYSGNSPDLGTAKKIALQNAKTELANNIQSVLKAVVEQYTNQRSVSNQKEFEQKFEENSRLVTNQALVDVRIFDEKVFQETDGTYTYWVAIEMSKDPVVLKATQKISEDDKLKLDFDQHQFRKIFEEEMAKFKNGQ